MKEHDTLREREREIYDGRQIFRVFRSTRLSIPRLSTTVKIYSANTYIYEESIVSLITATEKFFHRNSYSWLGWFACNLSNIEFENKVVNETSVSSFRRASFRRIWWESVITTFPIGENMVMKTEKRRIPRPEIVISASTTETIVITDDIMKIAVVVDSRR